MVKLKIKKTTKLKKWDNKRHTLSPEGRRIEREKNQRTHVPSTEKHGLRQMNVETNSYGSCSENSEYQKYKVTSRLNCQASVKEERQCF